MALEPTVNQLAPGTFDYQTYDNSDQTLIAQSDLDTAFTASTDYIEYFVYNQNKDLIFPDFPEPLLDYDVREGDILLNPISNLENEGFDVGTYSIGYSFYRKRLASDIQSNYYFISEISSDRTEIRLDSNIIENSLIVSSANEFIDYREVSEYFVDFYLNFGENKTVIANNIKLEDDITADPTLIIKLYDPLPEGFDLKTELWVVELLSQPQLYEVNFPFEPIIEDDFTYLQGPNLSLDITQQTGTSGEQFSINTLINSNVTSSVNQIKSLLSEKEINININYENYSNFINFSSAKTRLENFYYKVGLIESSSNVISSSLGQVTSQTTNGFAFSASLATLTNQIDTIITNFDGYEYFLYYNSGSDYSYPKSNLEPPFNLFPTGSTEVLNWIGNAEVGTTYYGGQALSASNYDQNNRDWLYWAIPEYLREDPENLKYELFVDMVAQYYDNVWVYTKDITNKFDTDNRLDYGISKDLVADAIRDFGVKLYSNSFNTDDLFTAFLGLSPSGSLFPFPNITSTLPTPSGFEYVDTKVSSSNDIVPLSDVNKRVYKRIYHNIPYLLKTKGTIAGIRALITSYGIPDTILRISEFGGKDRNEKQDYDLKQDVFNYAFSTGQGTNPNNTITTQFAQNSAFTGATSVPNTIQFRFKTPGIPAPVNNVASTDIRYSQSLWSADDGGNFLLIYTGSGLVSGSYSGSIPDPYDTWGQLKWLPAAGDNPAASASISLPFFNGDWWSVQMDYYPTSSNLFAANEIDGKIGFYESGSVIGSYDFSLYIDSTVAQLNSEVTLGGNEFSFFSGSFQEYRFWNEIIPQNNFLDYTVNPYSVEGTSINSTPNELFFRAALGTQLDTGSRTSIHPRVTGSAVQITQSFDTNTSQFGIANPSGISPFITNVEDIFQDQVVAGIKNRITEKVHIRKTNVAEAPYGFDYTTPDDDGDFIVAQGNITGSTLSSIRSTQQVSYTSQSYTPNANILEVAFSPSNQINDDINAQLGYFNIGDYIGDPRFISSSDTSYPALDRLRDAYFEKYIKSYDVVDFIRLIKFFDNSLFKMIRDFTPARTSLVSGVVIKQHLLERNRQRPAQVTSSNVTLEGQVKPFPKDYNTGSSDFPQYANRGGSAIYKFTGGAGGSVNEFNGLQTYPDVLGTYGSLPGGINLTPVIISNDVVFTTNGTFNNTVVSANTGKGLYPINIDIALDIQVDGLKIKAIKNGAPETSQKWSEGNIITIPGNDFNQGAGNIVVQLTRAQIQYAGPVTVPSNRFNLTQSYDVNGTSREPYSYSIINGTYFNYSSSQFLSASYQGKGVETVSTQHEFYDGEFSGSNIVVTTQSLNPGCGPYLNVVDKGVLFNPIFFNGEINATELGTVTSTEFNKPSNTPYQGDAWIFSEKITDATIIQSTGANPIYNYVTSIKLSRIDGEGNDVTDYLEQNTNIDINFPDSAVFGGGICSYRIIGVIPEANSVRLRIALEVESNRSWVPNISITDTWEDTFSATVPLGTIKTDVNTTTNLITTLSINPFAFNGSNYSTFFDDLVTNPVGGFILTDINDNNTYNYTIETFTQISADEYRVTDPTLVSQTGNVSTLVSGDKLKVQFTRGGTEFFPITSSLNGGSENWSFQIGTSFTSSDSRSGDTDLWQQNSFKNTTVLIQEQFITCWSPGDSVANAFFPQNQPIINSISPNQFAYGGDGKPARLVPQFIGDDSGGGYEQGSVIGQYLAAGMLNSTNQANNAPTPNVWGYGAYTLDKTPNIPLNFIMDIKYSGSNLTTGGGQQTTTQTGNYHFSQSYNPLVAGTFSQRTTYSNNASTVTTLSHSFGVSGTYTSVLAAIAGYNGYSGAYGTIFTNNFFAANDTLYDDDGLVNVSDSIIPTPSFDTYVFLVNGNNTLKGIGRIPNSFNFNLADPKFSVLYSPTGITTVKIIGDTQTSNVSAVFTPSTLEEGVSPPLFFDTVNTLIPGNSGSLKDPSTISSPGGHPIIALAGTASLAYDFGVIQFSGSTTNTFTSNYAPFSASTNMSPTNGVWDLGTTSIDYFTAASQSTDGTISIMALNQQEQWENAALLSRPLQERDGEADWDAFTPRFAYNYVAFVETGSVFNATASIEFRGDVLQQAYFRENNIATFPVLIGSGLMTDTTGAQVWRDRYRFEETAAVGATRPGNGLTRSISWRMALKSNLNCQIAMSTFSINQTTLLYTFTPNTSNPVPQNFQTFVSTNDSQRNWTGTGLENNPSGNTNNNAYSASATAAGATPVLMDIQAWLKYTGSVNNGTDTGEVVDLYLTGSEKKRYSVDGGSIINIASSASNATGTFTNPLPYNSSTNASSSLNLSGGMYYIEYSMSGYNGDPNTTGTSRDFEGDFVNPFNNTQSIIITQTATQGVSEVTNPSASILPCIYYGNNSDQTNFGSIVQWSGSESGSVIAFTDSIGSYRFSGSFFPQDPNNLGWGLGDTFRMAIGIKKEGGNIGMVITEASMSISPYTSIYSPLTASTLEPNVYRVPITSIFAIPTFYANGVLPFAFALDCQPLLNNYNLQRPSRYIMDVDYNNTSGPIIPVNQQQILEDIAQRATVPDSNYEQASWTYPRYDGSRSTCQEINVFTYGDTGTLGQTPNVEIRFAYFAYFSSMTNPYPTVNNVTQLNVAYLIDEQEVATPPSLDGLSFEIMNSLYPPQSEIQLEINSGSSTLTSLNGLQTVQRVANKYEPITFSQTSSGGYASSIPLSGSGTISVYDNANNPNAKIFYGVSVIGQGVSINGAASISNSKTFSTTISPGFPDTFFEINAASLNSTTDDLFPYSSSAEGGSAVDNDGNFEFRGVSSLDTTLGTALLNPQTIFGETKVHTSFLYESGRDEMQIKLRCVLTRNGVETNIPFELEDIKLNAQYIGKSISCGSVLGRVEGGGSWRSGTMVKFNKQNNNRTRIARATPGLNSKKEIEVAFENPVINSLLYNRGVNWKPHGGNANGGPVEFLEWVFAFNTGEFIFNGLDKVRFEVEGVMNSGGGRSGLNVFYPAAYSGVTVLPTNFTVLGAYDSADGDNTFQAPFWATSASISQSFIEMLSPNFNEAYGSAWKQGFLNYVPGGSPFFPGGLEPADTRFPTITKPLTILENDQIRFGNNETYSYNIINVIPPEQNINSSGIARLKLELDKPIPSGSIDLDFFLVRRPIADASIVQLDIDYPYADIIPVAGISGSTFSSAGVILSEFPSELLEISSSQIINNLIGRGIIKS